MISTTKDGEGEERTPTSYELLGEFMVDNGEIRPLHSPLIRFVVARCRQWRKESWLKVKNSSEFRPRIGERASDERELAG